MQRAQLDQTSPRIPQEAGHASLTQWLTERVSDDLAAVVDCHTPEVVELTPLPPTLPAATRPVRRLSGRCSARQEGAQLAAVWSTGRDCLGGRGVRLWVLGAARSCTRVGGGAAKRERLGDEEVRVRGVLLLAGLVFLAGCGRSATESPPPSTGMAAPSQPARSPSLAEAPAIWFRGGWAVHASGEVWSL